MVERIEVVEQRSESMARMVLDRVAASPDREAFRYRVGESWQSMTWAETGEQVRAVAAGLLALGLRPEDGVAIIAGTRVEWILADFGVMCAGGATTTVYPSTLAADVAYIVGDAGCRFAIAEDATQVAKLREQRGQLAALERVVVIDSTDVSGSTADDWVMTLDELVRNGKEHLAAHPSEVDDAVAAVKRGQLATLIYTSGTTGKPKGVELVHDCWTYEGAATDALGILSADDLQYLWLPLSHSFGKMMLAAQLQIGFATAVDGDVARIVDNLAVVQPTFMAAAPRIFEKVYSRVTTGAAESKAKKAIFDWALSVGDQLVRAQQEGRTPGRMFAAQQQIADKLVFTKLRARFGGRLRYFISGSAALSKDIGAFFMAAGVPVLEGYGLTETSAAAFVNRPERNKLGTVGRPLPGTEVRIADDGEILVRGPGVMRGYHNLPDQTAETLTEDGWLHTGDIGELDEDGHLRITDRKKDLIKTSGGKYVAPQPIETQFKALCPYASQIVVHGDGRHFVSALVTLDPDAVRTWAHGTPHADAPYEEIVRLPEMEQQVAAAIDALNARLARWETIKKFAILPRDLSIEDGELTPSLKVKRRVVEKHYSEILDDFYVSTRE